MEAALFSIIINNYNYGRFLRDAIDSALAQTHPRVEVVVVDDGSTDDSREVIEAYRGRVSTVFKDNGGQASAINAGFSESHGSHVIFLDADDVLLPTAVAEAAARFRDPSIVKVQWPMALIDESGSLTGAVVPPTPLPEGSLLDLLVHGGPDALPTPSSSGSAWARRVLDRILPMPEPMYVTGADAYLAALAPIFGEIAALPHPRSHYRRHPANDSATTLTFEQRVDRGMAWFEHRAKTIRPLLEQMGYTVDLSRWRANSWWHRLRLACDDITATVAPEAGFLLVDDATLSMPSSFRGRRCVPFLEHDGYYWGAPETDAIAIEELGRARQAAAGYLVFTWTAFWWLDQYPRFHSHLRDQFPCLLSNSRVVIFDVRHNSPSTRLQMPEGLPSPLGVGDEPHRDPR